jgi:hypothetical protein
MRQIEMIHEQVWGNDLHEFMNWEAYTDREPETGNYRSRHMGFEEIMSETKFITISQFRGV